VHQTCFNAVGLKPTGSSGSHNQSPLRLSVFLDSAAPKSAATVRGLYNAYCGEEGLKNSTAEGMGRVRDKLQLCATWARTSAPCPPESIAQRDELLWLYMLSPRRAPFRSFGGCWLAHERSLAAARGHNEFASQIRHAIVICSPHRDYFRIQ
jgi:hypothetical protein